MKTLFVYTVEKRIEGQDADEILEKQELFEQSLVDQGCLVNFEYDEEVAAEAEAETEELEEEDWQTEAQEKWLNKLEWPEDEDDSSGMLN